MLLTIKTIIINCLLIINKCVWSSENLFDHHSLNINDFFDDHVFWFSIICWSSIVFIITTDFDYQTVFRSSNTYFWSQCFYQQRIVDHQNRFWSSTCFNRNLFDHPKICLNIRRFFLTTFLIINHNLIIKLFLIINWEGPKVKILMGWSKYKTQCGSPKSDQNSNLIASLGFQKINDCQSLGFQKINDCQSIILYFDQPMRILTFGPSQAHTHTHIIFGTH